MAECNLFNLFDINPWKYEARQMIDADAIIKEVWKNPHDAILLCLGVDVIDALSSPVAIKQNDGETALHIACKELWE
eukprot:6609976-Ditylum_brightwellii.AAC.1